MPGTRPGMTGHFLLACLYGRSTSCRRRRLDSLCRAEPRHSDDAEVASRALGIVLTKRGKHLGRDIPMCGVPIERADEYLHRLIALGHRVAVCEQLEDPAEARKRGGKSVVRRDVVRLVTPGTLTEDSLLDAKSNNY